MVYEMVVGLNVKDDAIYTDYRTAMKPLLTMHGGGFRYDFKVNEVLKNEEGKQINRVFTIFFESESRMESFFSNEEYLKIKKEFFEKSVGATTIISQYSR
jgi:uncharacterized protein (DUF1330 family)